MELLASVGERELAASSGDNTHIVTVGIRWLSIITLISHIYKVRNGGGGAQVGVGSTEMF